MSNQALAVFVPGPEFAKSSQADPVAGLPVRPPRLMGAFEFVVVAALRAAQLARGCRPRVEGHHTIAVLAQREVAEGRVMKIAETTDQLPDETHDR